MTKTLKQDAEQWAADYWDDQGEGSLYSENTSMRDAIEISQSAGAIGYIVGHTVGYDTGHDEGYEEGYQAALAGIKVDFGDLLGCCEDYSNLEADGGGTSGKGLKEMLEDAYYEGAGLAVERIKEGRWRTKN